jgi:solute carrier family 6 GABA transporter-like protein 6/8/11/12/13
VGLGNIWRFPYNAYRSGGGAFLLPYLTMLAACGVPLLFMELAVGQYTRRGPIGALGQLCPLLQGAGLGTVIISFLLSTYYNVILAWSLFYLFSSLQWPLPWTSCANWWNSARCGPGNGSVSASQEFFDRRVLQMTDGIDELGEPRLELLGLLLGAWAIVYFCLWKGVALTGKVVYVTATLPILLLLAFTARALTLPGAVDGILFFVTPDWEKAMEPQVWVNAASQVFNSVGIAFGSLIAFSSYNKFQGPVLRDTLIVTLVDAGVSLLCGVAVFAVLGNLAHEQGAPVHSVVADGPGLVFVVFPHALAQLPFPQVGRPAFSQKFTPAGLVVCVLRAGGDAWG